MVVAARETIRELDQAPIPLDLRREYLDAKQTIELADDVLHSPELGFGPLALLWWGLTTAVVGGAAYTVANVAASTAREQDRIQAAGAGAIVESLQNAGKAAGIGVWALLALGVYMIAQRARGKAA